MTALQEDLEALRSALSTSVVLLSACRTGRFVLWQRAGKNVCKYPFEAEPQRGILFFLGLDLGISVIQRNSDKQSYHRRRLSSAFRLQDKRLAETYRGRTYRRP